MNAPRTILAAMVFAALAAPGSRLAAQQKRALDHTDYALWKRIANETLSRNGQWLAYQLTPGKGDGTLEVKGLAQNRSAVVDRGVSPTITEDGRWLVARIAPMDSAVKLAKKEKKKPAEQPKDSLIVLDLRSLEPASAFHAERVKSFKVPEDDSRWMAYLLEKAPASRPARAERGEEPEAEAPKPAEAKKPEETKKPRTPDGATLVVRTLADGQERRFEHVVDYTFTKDGSALYYTASGEDGAADGVYRVGRSGEAQPVTTGEGRYLKLAVSDEGGRVAFVTDRDDRDAQAPAFALYLGGPSGAATSVVASGAPGLPDGWAPSENGTVSFSDSGHRVFFGSAERPVYEKPDSTPADEKVSVDIWNWKDPYLQPMQLLQASQERKRTYEALYDVNAGKVVQLATTDVPTVTVGDHGDGDVALGVSELPYRQLISWDGRYVDFYLVNTATGAHEKVEEKVKSYPRLSPDGKYVSWWDGNAKAWMAMDTHTKQVRNLTGSLDVAFYNELDDHPDLPPAYGSAGWTEGDGAFLAYDAYDIWMLDPSGRRDPRDVTEGMGRKEGLRFRYVPMEGRGGGMRFGRGSATPVPTDEDVTLSAFDVHTKAAGFYRDRFDGSRQPTRLMWGDAMFSGVRKAEDADVVLFDRQTFREFPDIWVTDEDFRSPRKVTDANPQQADYSWGTEELVHWVSDDGIPLDGILYKPDGFDPSRKYPMMVYFYERNSDNLHRYVIPAAGSSSINYSFYVSRGYLLFVPDIPYEIGYPGESAKDAVVPGVLSLVQDGFVDRKHIGVQGHSWGGYQIAFMVTRTNLFAAAEAGAPVSNMISAYGGIRWGSGMSREFQYEKTQSRIGGTIWNRTMQYIENSPVFWAPKIQTPLLMMHNDKDTAVPWYQGIELFTALRRLHKPTWLVVYNGEHHGLFREQDKEDWAVRMQQFFDHYLKGAPAPVWLQEGVPAVVKGKTLGLQLEKKGASAPDGGAGS